LAAEREEAGARGYLRNAMIYSSLAKIAGNKKVRETCSEEDVRKIVRSAESA
jgi:hypothetical protein